MTRRSWLQNVFGGENSSDRYFFGLQLVINAFGEDSLRARLAEVIDHPEGAQQDVAAKRRYLKRIVALLIDQEPYWSQVFWDYKTENAEAEFESWAAELSAATATEAEELDTAIDPMRRLSNDKDYVAATILLLLNEPYPPADVKDENDFWKSTTISNLVRGLLLLNPETVIADGVFVMPGSGEDGLSEEDLLTGGWSYLRVIN